jgi:hypothetical protein
VLAAGGRRRAGTIAGARSGSSNTTQLSVKAIPD